MTAHVKSPVVPPGTDRRFFTGLAVAVALTVFAGFAPTYYLKGLYGTPVLSPFLHFHGMLFTSWILLFVAQTTLVAAKRTDLHRRLGIVGALLAVAMLVVGAVGQHPVGCLQCPLLQQHDLGGGEEVVEDQDAVKDAGPVHGIGCRGFNGCLVCH